jgi:PhzF family phenazine biosynthesis protein
MGRPVCTLEGSPYGVLSRFFTPSEGINEDPVTGSANGPLGAYCVQFGLVPQNDGLIHLVGEQGDAIGRKGRVSIRIGCAGGTIQSVEIAGKAVSMFTAELRIV